MRGDIVAGAVFPDYELTDHAGRRRTLSELQGPDPMILVLSRGGYCPKDLRQAEGLVHLGWRSFDRTCVLCSGNAVRIGTSRRPKSKLSGNGANTVAFIPMERPTGRSFRSKSNRRSFKTLQVFHQDG